MPERETQNFDFLVTRMPNGKVEASIGFDYDKFQEDLSGLFKQEQTNGLEQECNGDAQKNCVARALLNCGDEIEVHHRIVEALLQSYPKMKLPSRNKRAGELLNRAKVKIKNK